jgi:hypothetical protein
LGDAIIVRLQWRGTTGPEDHEMFQVLRFCDNKVVEMEDHRTERGATKAAKALTAKN